MKTFKCLNCDKIVEEDSLIGTSQRNHCPYCLYSQHLDLEVAGDRKSDCKASMEPIGLTFKKEGIDKYGKERKGEIMIIHRCTGCGKISINRIAGDDEEEEINKLFEKTLKMEEELKLDFKKQDIIPLKKEDGEEFQNQLFGRS